MRKAFTARSSSKVTYSGIRPCQERIKSPRLKFKTNTFTARVPSKIACSGIALCQEGISNFVNYMFGLYLTTK